MSMHKSICFGNMIDSRETRGRLLGGTWKRTDAINMQLLQMASLDKVLE